MFAFSGLVAFSFTFGHLVADEIAPEVLTAWRFVIAAVVMGLIGAVQRYDFARLRRFAPVFLVIGGAMACYFITMFVALRHTSALNTSVVFTLTPMMAALIGWAVLRQPVGARIMAALAVGCVGALWVIFRGDPARALGFDIGYGERVFFAGALAHAAVPALTRKLAPEARAFDAAFGTVLGALIVTCLYAGSGMVRTDYAALPATVLWVALYLGVATTAASFFLLQVGVARLSPGKVMAYTYLVPSWVVLHGMAAGRFETPVIYVGVTASFGALLILMVARDGR